MIQKEKDKYHMLSHMWDLKYGTKELNYSIETDWHRKQAYCYKREKRLGREKSVKLVDKN